MYVCGFCFVFCDCICLESKVKSFYDRLRKSTFVCVCLFVWLSVCVCVHVSVHVCVCVHPCVCELVWFDHCECVGVYVCV